MSVESAMIARRDTLPATPDLVRALKDFGVRMTFPADFRLEASGGGHVGVDMDGEATGFGYGVDALADLLHEDDSLCPAAALGDAVLSFSGKGRWSNLAVAHVQHALAARWGLAGYIDGELIPADRFAREMAEHIATEPEFEARLQATLRETEAEGMALARAAVAAEEAARPPVNPVMAFVRTHSETLIGVGLAALLLIYLLVWN